MVIKDAINLAVSAHQSGDLEGAESRYREILEVDPDNFLHGIIWDYSICSKVNRILQSVPSEKQL